MRLVKKMVIVLFLLCLVGCDSYNSDFDTVEYDGESTLFLKTYLADDSDFFDYGLANSNGEFVIPPIYTLVDKGQSIIGQNERNFIFSDSDEYLRVSKYTTEGRKFGLINYYGDIVIDVIYDDLLIIPEASKVYVRKSNKKFLYDLVVEDFEPFTYELIDTFDSYLVFCDGQNQYIYDSNLNRVLDETYDEIEYYDEEYLIYVQNNELYVKEVMSGEIVNLGTVSGYYLIPLGVDVLYYDNENGFNLYNYSKGKYLSFETGDLHFSEYTFYVERENIEVYTYDFERVFSDYEVIDHINRFVYLVHDNTTDYITALGAESPIEINSSIREKLLESMDVNPIVSIYRGGTYYYYDGKLDLIGNSICSGVINMYTRNYNDIVFLNNNCSFNSNNEKTTVNISVDSTGFINPIVVAIETEYVVISDDNQYYYFEMN